MLDKDVQSLGFLTNKKITEATDAVREDVAEHGEKQRQELLDHVETKVNSLGDYITQRLSSDYEQVNQSIAEQSSGVLVKTQAELERASEVLQAEMLETRDDILQRMDALDESCARTINERTEKQSIAHALELNILTEQLKAQEIFEGQLLARIETIKDGEKGDQGEPGEDGKDRPLLEPVEIKQGKEYPKNTLGLYQGGLWISTKQAVDNPDSDPHSWSCILDSMTTMSIDLQEDKTFKLSVRMATGKTIDSEFKIPYPEHKGIWEAGSYSKGEMVTKGHSFWMAIEDTDGEPPGNGWQQVLSAPRGKTGPAGKSIEGPQGKPGRNGLDAKLPDGFVDELLELASTNKAFDDGRSGAEVITSFRGYFAPDESYNRGDVVNHDGSLYLNIVSGSFDSIAKGRESWELMLGVPKQVSQSFMLWQGSHVQKTYNAGMLVSDGPWTMVAKTQTNDSAAPYPVGDETYLAAGATYAPLADTVKNVIFGTRIKQTQAPIFIRGYKIDVINTFSYRVFFVQDPLNSPIVVELDSFTATATETVEFNLGRIPVGAGDSFDLVAIINEPDPTPTEWTGDWNYETPPSNGIPQAAHILQANENTASLRISIFDNPITDRSAELAALSPGDTVTDGTTFWTISQSVDNGTWFDFTVSPAQQSPTDGIRTFTFGTTTPTAITIGSDADYWLGNENIRGIHAVDGGYSDVVEDDNAYSIDIQVQDAYVSPDWDVVAYSSELGAKPEAIPVFTAQETAWVRESASQFDTGTIETTGATWTEVDRRQLADPSTGKIVTDAKRVDGIGYHSSEWSFMAYSDGTQLVSHLQKDTEIGTDLSFRLVEDGNDLVFEVRGKPNQTWQWKTTAFYRGLD